MDAVDTVDTIDAVDTLVSIDAIDAVDTLAFSLLFRFLVFFSMFSICLCGKKMNAIVLFLY